MTTVGRRFTISEQSSSTLTSMSETTGLDEGKLVEIAINHLAEAGNTVIASAIVDEAQAKADALLGKKTRNDKS